MEAQGYNEGLATFFIERLCREADGAYKFGFALTLNQRSAEGCVKSAYKSLLGNLGNLLHKSTEEIRIEILKACWVSYENAQSDDVVESSQFASFLSSLSVEQRSTLVLVDGAILMPEEVGKVIGMDEGEVRTHLAEARKLMIKKYGEA
jgi:DNA-directed RNA polymerase specialized sigma24 family protein